ncbi:hypothetical protein B0H19DRAFT_1171410 [Mycena capillaripes]|nr:hypothetical protein B0H19DRAFT_1171410 [Mycena capillaripes]
MILRGWNSPPRNARPVFNCVWRPELPACDTTILRGWNSPPRRLSTLAARIARRTWFHSGGWNSPPATSPSSVVGTPRHAGFPLWRPETPAAPGSTLAAGTPRLRRHHPPRLEPPAMPAFHSGGQKRPPHLVPLWRLELPACDFTIPCGCNSPPRWPSTLAARNTRPLWRPKAVIKAILCYNCYNNIHCCAKH